jgi:hypothetical protein
LPEAEALLRDAAARARRREMPVFELWCLSDLSRLLGPARPDAAVSARIRELSHLEDLERRAAEALRQHGHGGLRAHGGSGGSARRHEAWSHRAADKTEVSEEPAAPADSAPLPRE